MQELAEIVGRARRVLVRGVNWLGDAVMSTPALLRLREALPEAHITMLCHEKLEDLWLAHPAVDKVMTFTTDEGLWSVAQRLAAENFEVALIFPNSPRSALQVWLARVPVRVGMAGGWRRVLLTHAVAHRPHHVPMRKRTEAEIRKLQAGQMAPEPPPPAEAHHVYHYLHLAGAVGADVTPLAPQVRVAPDTLASVAKRIGPLRGPLVGINPGAEYGPAKRWPLEHFAAAAREIVDRYGAELILFGGHRDRETAAGLAKKVGGEVRNWAGETTLGELCAALKCCRVVVSNDSGPMHLAAAVGTPVVALFGSTSPILSGPGLPGDPQHGILRAGAPCSPCFLRECPVDLRCLKGIPVAAVVEAVGKVLQRPAAG